jgi:hypothetical protein
VAIYDDAPRGDGLAYPAWRLRGAGESFLESYTFYVDAVSGVVVRYHSNIAHAHASGDIEGKVNGYATPGLAPDVPITSDPGLPWHECDNEPDLFDLADVHVAAYDGGNGTLVAAAPTDLSGAYTLEISTSGGVNVFAELKGPLWVILDGSTDLRWSSDPPDPLPHSGNPVTAPAMGVDLQFNPTPTEKWTGFVNAHRAMSKTVRWLDLEDNAVPVVPVLVHIPVPDPAYFPALDCVGAGYTPSAGGPGGGVFFFERAPQCSQFYKPVTNGAYSTVVAHEYGHFIATNLMDVEFGPDTAAFHEGFSDSLTLLIFDTEVFAEDFYGCDQDLRYPRQPSIAAQQVYPKCKPGSMDPPNCSMGWGFDHYCAGELLPAIWRDLHDEFDDEDTRDLFLDWMMIAQTPAAFSCPLGTTTQGAGPNTLVEVLQVAESSQHAAICEIFLGRAIEPPDPDECPDSAGWSCYADCDGSGAPDFWDFLCFQNAFAASLPYADCDGDDNFTFFDFLCFQTQFIAGCS